MSLILLHSRIEEVSMFVHENSFHFAKTNNYCLCFFLFFVVVFFFAKTNILVSSSRLLIMV